jgi:glycosyltransferase involved in cell wall biosynthesis
VPGGVGGSETYVRGLLGELGASVTVVERPRGGGSEAGRLLGIAYGLTAEPRLRAPVDVVHYPLTVPVPRFDGPTVVTLHDLQHVELPDFFSSAERIYRRFAYEGAARRASVVVTPSEHARSTATDRLGLDPDRVIVAPHGVDHSRFFPDEAERKPFLLYPANLWPHKNHARLLEALARADSDLELVLTGNDYGRREELVAEAARLGVGDRVRHLGFVAHGELPRLLREARAMIFPSLYEGFGQPPLEAMACGCAVASSVEGALGEVCAGAVLELDPRDLDSIASAIDRLASDDALVENLRARGPERAQAYTWARSADLHMTAYRLALG